MNQQSQKDQDPVLYNLEQIWEGVQYFVDRAKCNSLPSKEDYYTVLAYAKELIFLLDYNDHTKEQIRNKPILCNLDWIWTHLKNLIYKEKCNNIRRGDDCQYYYILECVKDMRFLLYNDKFKDEDTVFNIKVNPFK